MSDYLPKFVKIPDEYENLLYMGGVKIGSNEYITVGGID